MVVKSFVGREQIAGSVKIIDMDRKGCLCPAPLLEWLFSGDQVVGRHGPAHHQEYCEDSFEVPSSLYGFCYGSDC
jgi:hypothetical protein